jgi:glucose/arabinose dehydrogenase
MRSRSALAGVAAAVVAAGLLAGCTGGSGQTPPSSTAHPLPLSATGGPAQVVTGLASPWSILQLADGRILVSERDSGRIVRVDRGLAEPIGTVPGVVHTGEGGLLGLAFCDGWLYAYETTASDNRVVRMRLGADLALGEPHVLLDGLAKAADHDGGRIAFGPDGLLYVTVATRATPRTHRICTRSTARSCA